MRRGLTWAVVALALAASGCAARRQVASELRRPAAEAVSSAHQAPAVPVSATQPATTAKPRPVRSADGRRPVRRQAADSIPSAPARALPSAPSPGEEAAAFKTVASTQPTEQPQSTARSHETEPTSESPGEYDARWGRPRPCKDCPGGQ